VSVQLIQLPTGTPSIVTKTRDIKKDEAKVKSETHFIASGEGRRKVLSDGSHASPARHSHENSVKVKPSEWLGLRAGIL
jgi:hypothetical protein